MDVSSTVRDGSEPFVEQKMHYWEINPANKGTVIYYSSDRPDMADYAVHDTVELNWDGAKVTMYGKRNRSQGDPAFYITTSPDGPAVHPWYNTHIVEGRYKDAITISGILNTTDQGIAALPRLLFAPADFAALVF